MATPELVLETAQPQLSLRQKLAEIRLPWIPIAVLVVLIVCAAFAHWLAPHDPTSLNVIASKQAPFESRDHLLGTDVLGRDMLSRLIYGARTTVQISVTALALGAVIGTVIGLVSGYWGGWADAVLMRVTDAALGFPTILLALVVVVIMNPGPPAIILAVLLTVWGSSRREVPAMVKSSLPEPLTCVCSVAEIRLAYSRLSADVCSVIWRPRCWASTGALIMLTASPLTCPSSPTKAAAFRIAVLCSAISPW